MNQRLSLAAAVLGALICAGLALGLVISGQVFVPGGMWARGYVGGIPAYSMAFAWLALGAALLFAGCMRAFPSSYFHNRRRRDIALVIFGLAFVFTVVGFIIDKAGVRAL